MRVLKDFQEFAFKGNVMDLAVGVVIGAAFGKIVSGIVDDLIMPAVGLVLPAGNWRDAGIVIGHKANPDAATAAAHPVVDVKLGYGHLLGTTIDFLIVALVLFLVVSAIARMRRKQAAAPESPATRECPECFETISAKAKRCPHCTGAIAPLAA